MQQEAADELLGPQTRHLHPISPSIIAVAKAHGAVVEIEEPLVADGDASGYSQHLLGSANGGLE